MKVRAVEWVSESPQGWVRISEGQLDAGPPHVVVNAVDLDEDDEAPFIQTNVAYGTDLASGGADSLRVVLHHGVAEPTGRLEAFLLDALPQLTHASRVATVLRDHRDESLVMASARPGRGVNLRRVRLAAPGSPGPDGDVRWLYGNMMLLEETAFVCWDVSTSADGRVAGGIDTAARNGIYSGVHDAKTPSLSRLGNAYLEAALAAVERVALECRRRLDVWESDFVSSTVSASASSAIELDLDLVRNLRRVAARSRIELDEMERRARAIYSWSDFEFTTVVDKDLESAFARAEVAVDRLRADIADALGLINTVRIGQQLASAKTAEDRAGQLQTAVSFLTAFLIVPALIGTVFGADVAHPGATPHDRAVIMYAAMGAGALLTFVLLRVHRWWANRRSDATRASDADPEAAG